MNLDAQFESLCREHAIEGTALVGMCQAFFLRGVALGERGQWLPIETAPRTGDPFLAYRPLAQETDDPVMSIVHGMPSDQRCWEQTVPEGMDRTNFTSGYCKATHWMPLPAGPGDPT